MPYIDDLLGRKVRQWIVAGGADEEWYKFRRDLEDIGLSRLVTFWQKEFESSTDDG